MFLQILQQKAPAKTGAQKSEVTAKFLAGRSEQSSMLFEVYTYEMPNFIFFAEFQSKFLVVNDSISDGSVYSVFDMFSKGAVLEHAPFPQFSTKEDPLIHVQVN